MTSNQRTRLRNERRGNPIARITASREQARRAALTDPGQEWQRMTGVDLLGIERSDHETGRTWYLWVITPKNPDAPAVLWDFKSHELRSDQVLTRRVEAMRRRQDTLNDHPVFGPKQARYLLSLLHAAWEEAEND